MNRKAGIVAISAASKLSIILTLLLCMLPYLIIGIIFLWQILGFLSGVGLFASDAIFQFPLSAESSLGLFIFLKLIICLICFIILRALYKKIKLLEAEYNIPLESAISDASKKYESISSEIKVISKRFNSALADVAVPTTDVISDANETRLKCPLDKASKVRNIVVDHDEFWRHFSEANPDMSDIELRMHFDNSYVHFLTTTLGVENLNAELNIEPKARAEFVKYMLS